MSLIRLNTNVHHHRDDDCDGDDVDDNDDDIGLMGGLKLIRSVYI